MKNLKAARDLLGWSQLEVDRRCGFKKGKTNDLERRVGKASFKDVEKIAQAFRDAGLSITAQQLYGVHDEARVAS